MLKTNDRTIESADVEDIPAIITIARATWWPTYRPILQEEQVGYMFDVIYTPEALRKQMEELKHTFLLLHAENQAMAFASFSPRSEEPSVFKLHKIYLRPEGQGKGLGRYLLDEVIERVRLAGGKWLDLNVNRDNPARLFYERCGFHIVREEDIPIGPYFMNDYVMRRSLEQ